MNIARRFLNYLREPSEAEKRVKELLEPARISSDSAHFTITDADGNEVDPETILSDDLVQKYPVPAYSSL